MAPSSSTPPGIATAPGGLTGCSTEPPTSARCRWWPWWGRLPRTCARSWRRTESGSSSWPQLRVSDLPPPPEHLPFRLGSYVVYRPTGQRCYVAAYADTLREPYVEQRGRLVYRHRGQEVRGPYVLQPLAGGEVFGAVFDDLELVAPAPWEGQEQS